MSAYDSDAPEIKELWDLAARADEQFQRWRKCRDYFNFLYALSKKAPELFDPSTTHGQTILAEIKSAFKQGDRDAMRSMYNVLKRRAVMIEYDRKNLSPSFKLDLRVENQELPPETGGLYDDN